VIWLHPIQQVYADFHAGFYPAENLVAYENSVQRLGRIDEVAALPFKTYIVFSRD
jgi:hypothetical protein